MSAEQHSPRPDTWNDGWVDQESALERLPPRALMDAVDVGVIIVAASGTVVYGNPAAAEKFGFPSGGLRPGPLDAFTDQFDLLSLDGVPLPVEEWPLARALRGECVESAEVRVRRKDRAWSRLHRHSARRVREADGTATFVLLTIKDISDRGRLEEQLRCRVEELETLMDVVPVALFVSNDPRCDHMVGNRTANSYYATDPGDNLSANPSPAGPEPARRFFAGGRELAAEELPMQVAAARSSSVHGVEVEVRQRDGRRFTMLGSATPLRDELGAVRGCVGAFLDITEWRATQAELARALSVAEQQRRELEIANRELEAFGYSVSHDLQGPLRAINGFTHALGEDYGAVLDDGGRACLGRIQTATLRMTAIIEGLLALSRVSRAELNLGPVDLTALAFELKDQLMEADRARAVEFEIAPDLQTRADATLMRLLLQNLFGNAWKFTATRPRARIVFLRSEENGRTAFVVRDNGVGFEMAYAHKLFQPFERLHSAEAFPGTGIGLATVWRIVHRHGGTVWAKGTPELGAEFFFQLPEGG